MVVSIFLANLISLRRRGVESSLSRTAGVEPATRVLQVRAHLATHTGSPGGPKLVASSRATSNTGVAGSVGRFGLRENRCIDRGIQAECDPMKTRVGETRKNWLRRLETAAFPIDCLHARGNLSA